MQVLPVIVPYIKTTSNIAISCRTLRDWLSNNGFAIKSTKAGLCAENLSLYKLLKYPKLDQWTSKEFTKVIETNDPDQLLLLLKNGANIEAKDNGGSTALITAALNSNTDCLKILLDCKANIEAKANYGDTALMWTARWGNVECLKILLEHKANIEAKANYGDTALILAALNGKIKCIQLLLGSGATVDPKTREEYSQYAELWLDSTL